jgi:hypothetical protein
MVPVGTYICCGSFVTIIMHLGVNQRIFSWSSGLLLLYDYGLAFRFPDYIRGRLRNRSDSCASLSAETLRYVIKVQGTRYLSIDFSSFGLRSPRPDSENN